MKCLRTQNGEAVSVMCPQIRFGVAIHHDVMIAVLPSEMNEAFCFGSIFLKAFQINLNFILAYFPNIRHVGVRYRANELAGCIHRAQRHLLTIENKRCRVINAVGCVSTLISAPHQARGSKAGVPFFVINLLYHGVGNRGATLVTFSLA
ncbi:hypothetical protein [Cynomolgus macaque cytomegalovirus strain Mauritius]|uniref:Uncharacterized protein n=1 Tax=Cynomolgus macaque cytomegalovirus strain Mauritius TaxID=1690255 RepID=A0A0K1H055_9BETA|nr:hypothetical protein [Cynomolgus macaque cytomegalovirus strain Mauritius]AXG21813.1 hypothetical protein [synthetic construct]AXG22080.1 hypothetical protein [synthetic construct]